MSRLTDHVIEFALGLELDTVPPVARASARHCIADCLGVTVAGSSSDVGDLIIAYLTAAPSAPQARLVGHPRLVSFRDAALGNGTMSHALDLDDDEPLLLIGHPTAPVLSALIALAHETRPTGAAMLASVIAGIEVELAIGDVVNPHHYDRGWHTTSTIGTLGATVACARLLELDRTRTRTALGIAASTIAGLKRNFGTMTKPLHVGRAAEAAVLATTLARAGFTADQAILDGEFGLVDALDVPDLEAASAKLRGLGQRWGLIDPGVAIKRYPSCSNTHPALDAVAELKARGACARGVRSIVCRVAPGTDRMLQYRVPTTGLEGKFSMHYCLAAAIVHGPPWIEEFSDDAVRDPALQSVMAKVEMIPDPALQISPLGVSTAASVTVVDEDGNPHEQTVLAPIGSGRRPLDTGQVREKFMRCCGALSIEPAARVFDALVSLESEPDFAGILDELIGPVQMPSAVTT